MRIIAGLAKGRKILSPEGMETRPTLDRVKEAIFNIIQGYVPDSRVIDVFAGTGSLGLEAVSRGAKECILVDKGQKTFEFLKMNVDKLNFNDMCVCCNMDSYTVLKECAKKNKKFDIIFIDPPYSKEMIPPAIDIISDNLLLSTDGLIVTKIDSTETIYKGNEKIVLIDHRIYGNTTVCFYRYKED